MHCCPPAGFSIVNLVLSKAGDVAKYVLEKGVDGVSGIASTQTPLLLPAQSVCQQASYISTSLYAGLEFCC